MAVRILLLCLCAGIGNAVLADDYASIHRMVARDSVVELSDTRQVTSCEDGPAVGAWISPDGKYVAYWARPKHEEDFGYVWEDRLSVASCFGSRRAVLVTCSDLIRMSEPEHWEADPEMGVSWSPDSRRVALYAARVSEAAGVELCAYVLLFAPTGELVTKLPVPEDWVPTSAPCWSPDGRRLAGAFESMAGEFVGVFEVSSGSARAIGLREDAHISFEVWRGSGALQYVVESADAGTRVLREFQLQSSKDRVVAKQFPNLTRSADRRFEVLDAPGMRVRDCVSGKETQVFKSRPGEIKAWTPDGEMIVYQTKQTIEDPPGGRSRVLHMLWVACCELGKLNHMCVALDHDEYAAGPTWSRDCSMMAYVCQGRVCLAELARRGVDVADKLAAGIRLTEEEEKALLSRNAKQIGIAINMYTQDWDFVFPSQDDFLAELRPYCRDDSIFCRPGTDQIIFQYVRPVGTMDEMDSPWETTLGFFDVGYGWRVNLYVDGHTEVVRK